MNFVRRERGFTLIELMVVIGILGLLSSMVLSSLSSAKKKSYTSVAKSEMQTFATVLELYYDDHETYPPDYERNVFPPELVTYLANRGGTDWPAPWPGSYYDWDSWDDPLNPGQKIYQISIRFCPLGGNLSSCHFPTEPWSASFGIDSAAYWCIGGACRSHVSQPIGYPGYCLNC